MTDTKTTIEVLGAVVARLERDLGEDRLYGEQQCARAEKAKAHIAELEGERDDYRCRWEAVSDRCNAALFDLKYARKLAESLTRRAEKAERHAQTIAEAAAKMEADLAAARKALRYAMDDAPGWYDLAQAAARGEHHDPVKSCETCRWEKVDGETEPCSACVNNPGTDFRWQPKSDVCPTCEGRDWINSRLGDCPDCGGTGKKETK